MFLFKNFGDPSVYEVSDRHLGLGFGLIIGAHIVPTCTHILYLHTHTHAILYLSIQRMPF